ncbi:MAG: dephospho-CoA kinase [Methylomicrobium sp.]
MLRIGLTGGIGSGKTTVSNLFAELNVPIIDADIIARRLVTPGKPALQAILETFGERVIAVDGSLNRAAMRQLIFDDTEKKQKLESILHPLIRCDIETELVALTAPYCLLCIPLLFETGMFELVDRILVVDCPVETQIQRVIERDRLDEKTIRAIIASQAPRKLRLSRADDVIDNSALDSALAEQVKKLHNLYLSLTA